MGLFKGIKNLLFEEVDEHGRPIKRPEPTPAPVSEPVAEQVKNVTPAPASNANEGSGEPEIDERVLDKIIAMLDEKNIPGPDYLELKKAANDEVLLKSIPDESVRFSVSYATLKATAPTLSKQQILQSILTYIQYIEDERARGISQFDALWQEQVVAREEAIAKSKVEIEELQERLDKLQKFVNEQEAQVVAVKADCGKKKGDFNATVDYMIGKLRMDGAKLEEILKE